MPARPQKLRKNAKDKSRKDVVRSFLFPFDWTTGLLVLLLAASQAPAGSDAPVPIRSRQVELHYRIAGAGPEARVELWYTRDRGATWQRGSSAGTEGPIVFTAPGEGLYGLTLLIAEEVESPPPPAPHEPPQRWVFVDCTPPLVQWDGVEPAEDFASSRTLHLRWTAHDDHFPSRPISLAYQDPATESWHTIVAPIPNTGRYDWRVPPELGGRLSLKITARDLGGAVAERIYSGLDLPGRELAAASQPAESAAPGVPSPTSQPADAPPLDTESAVPATLADQRHARSLHQQGNWHLLRGEYALAAERFQEALESDSDFVDALTDLAGVHYLQGDAGRALEFYHRALEEHPRHPQALRGAALACVARRQYAQAREFLERLLAAHEQDMEARLDLGDVMFMLGDQPQARRHWSQVAASTGPDSLIRKARQRLALYGIPQLGDDVNAAR